MSEESVEREAGSCFVILRSGKTPLPSALEAPNAENPAGDCMRGRPSVYCRSGRSP